ncbi:MAG TPA: UPF0158 family protein [bacterium]|nr:UPF0158 family protein [bacterium]
MNLSSIDREALSRALDDHDPDRELYLSLVDGTLQLFVLSEATDETRALQEKVQSLVGKSFVRVTSMTSQEAFEEMEDFADSLDDASAKDALFRTLEGKGAFRRFREVMLENAPLRERWMEFRAQRSQNRLEKFLRTLSSPKEVTLPESSS